MKYDAVKNPNYVATVVHVTPGDLFSLAGLDNLRGYTKFGMQALTSHDIEPGLYLLFSTEVQLSHEFAHANNLYRDPLSNADPRAKVGYLEQSRRVKAIKLRGHRSESLLMPLSSLSYLLSAKDLAKVAEGDVFDSIDGHEICRKYLVKQPKEQGAVKAKARVRRVSQQAFPEHLDSENYFRNLHKIPDHAHVTVSQKLHGTSVRYGNVPALADQTWWERLLRRPRRTTHRFVVGSRRVVKSLDLSAEEGKDHYYAAGDLWTAYADQHPWLVGSIPKDHVVYGELVGFTGTGEAIQKDYTYDQDPGTARLYVYRVSVIGTDGHTIDYSPEQMRTFCEDRGLSVVPVLWAGPHSLFAADHWLEKRYYDDWVLGMRNFPMAPVPLSDKKLVDEGVCVRYDGPHGTYILKAKSPTFVRHETAVMDAGVEDLESAEADAPAELEAVPA